MTAEMLAGYAGVVVSLLFSYVPKLSSWYDALETVKKQLIMGGLLVLITAAVYALACTGYAADFGLAVSCDRKGAIEMINVLIAALVANQGTYLITRR